MASAIVTPLPTSRTPRSRTPGGRLQQISRDYDPRLDDHQQIYVLSPRVMNTLIKTMKESSGVFTSPSDKIGFHGPRRPLLLSYPAAPKEIGKASFHTTFREKGASSSQRVSLPETGEGKQSVKTVLSLRSDEFKNELQETAHTGKIMPGFQSKPVKLAKEKGFVLDGVAVSSIQEDYSKVQPKLGPAIPPYNAHFDRHASNYFKAKGLQKTLRKTGQMRHRSVSMQGRAVDRFHFVGIGHDYLYRRNLAGAGYSRDAVDGHDQFLSSTRAMNGYNGRFGYRRNTPGLRYCPSPFGSATWSSLY